MKKLVFLMVLSTLSAPAYSECTLRTTSTLRTVGVINDITYNKFVTSKAPDHQIMCSVTAKVLYKGKWEDIQMSYTGDEEIGEKEICANAVEVGVRQFLASKEEKKYVTDQQMNCTDEQQTKTHPVKLGETVKLSEVELDPKNYGEFRYSGTYCRNFVEVSPKNGELYTWHGVICKTGRPDADTWTVINKF